MSGIATPLSATRRIIEAVARSFAVEIGAILSPGRRQPVAAARQTCMALLIDGFDRNSRPRSLNEVARVFRRDHTTVLHGVRRYRQICAEIGLPRKPVDLEAHTTILALHLGYVSPAFAAERLASKVDPKPAAPCHPVETVAAPSTALVVQHEPEPAPMVATLPARLSNGAEFGTFSIEGWRSLPDPMRRDGVLLFLERDEAEYPARREHDRMARASAVFDLSVDDLTDLIRSRERHVLPDENAMKRIDVLAEREVIVLSSTSGADGFAEFARRQLRADASGATSVATAYAAYAAFARADGFDLLPRSQFGFELKRFAGGADRAGDMQMGVAFGGRR